MTPTSFRLPLRVLLPCVALLWLAALYQALMGWSAFEYRFTDVVQAVLTQPDSLKQQLIAEVRVPRSLIAMLVGAALAVAGVLMQAITRNPMASPSLFGINAGAACMLVLAGNGWLPWLNDLPLLGVTVMGAALAGFLVMLLGGMFKGRMHPVRVLLAGVAVSATLTALTRTLLILDEQAQSVIDWLSGSLADTGWDHWQAVWPWICSALILAMCMSRSLNLLALGDTAVVGLGIRPQRVRLMASILVVVLTAAAVSVAGPVAFVGLMVPHLVRVFTGPDHRRLLPVAAMGGALLMLLADGTSRGLAFPVETPVGILTGLIGAPFFLYLACRRRGER